MVVKVLVVVDDAIEAALREALSPIQGVEVVLVAPDLRYETVLATDDLTYAVLHDVVFEARTNVVEPEFYQLVGALRDKRILTAILLTKVEDDDLKKAVFLSSVDLGIDLGEKNERTALAIARIVSRIEALALPLVAVSDEALMIGTLVPVDFGGNSQAPGEENKPGTAYRMARWRSLVPLDGSEFSQDVRDVMQALSPFPLRVDVPWDPRERSGTPEWPGLRDVYRAFADTPEALQRLYGSQPPPITSDAARTLLGPAKPEETLQSAYARWWRAWEGGSVHPPALLIDGETGVGKSLMAEFVGFLLNPRSSELEAEFPSWKPPKIKQRHLTSRDRFVKFNGAALKSSDVADLMMGSAPGAWTGMSDASIGQLARAAHGVFFLDELGDMPLDAQASILTFLDTREIRPKGMDSFQGFQHIIAATNKKLSEAVADGAFRQDLLARFKLRLTIPPLRDRSMSDRARLVDFLAQDPAVNRTPDGEFVVTHFDRAALNVLVSHDYRNGNFRELAERVHESIRRAKRRLSPIVTLEDVPAAELPIRKPSAGVRKWRPTSRGGY